MKRGYYIHFDARMTPGVSKKISMQMAEFAEFFHMEEINIQAKDVSLMRRICRLLPGGAVDRTYGEALTVMENPDFVYIRRATADREYKNFIGEIKARWPECRVLVEVFTYPYDRDEFMKLLSWPYYFKERRNRKRLVKYIDRYIVFSDDPEIFGIPTIRTGNGIRVDDVALPAIKAENREELHLIAVAFMQKHHGYERMIRGMNRYYQKNPKRRVFCHLVGDGPEKKKYQKLVKRYHLEDRVIFYPTTKGDELDRLYEKGDVAVSSLGWYKDGLDKENTLKSKEYMAKGFPMVSGCNVYGVDSDYPFLCQFPNNKTPLDIERILDFYDGLCDKYSRKEMQTTIREYAERIADMPVVMKPVIDYIQECRYEEI